jgi:hypothetical protein
MPASTADTTFPVATRPGLAAVRGAAMAAFVGLLLTACSPEPTPAEPTPVPEEEPAPQVVAGEATELRDAIQAPQDKARAVEDTLMQAADAQREAIDAAEGGEAVPPEGG